MKRLARLTRPDGRCRDDGIETLGGQTLCLLPECSSNGRSNSNKSSRSPQGDDRDVATKRLERHTRAVHLAFDTGVGRGPQPQPRRLSLPFSPPQNHPKKLYECVTGATNPWPA